MRIIVWGINYSPELTGIAPFNAGLCDDLKSRGHDVEMVTAFPYYPFWKKIDGDRGKLFRKDDFDGVALHRCWHYVPTRVTPLRRIWHEVSFGLFSLLRILTLRAADVYVIVSPPLILGPLASLLCAIKRRPYVFHVQDLQPDAAVGLGMVKVGSFTRLLYRFERWSYRNAAAVSGISQGMLEAFKRKKVPVEKQWLSPNWIRWYGRNANWTRDQRHDGERGTRFREKYQIPRETFLVSYSGNLGRKQGLENLLEAAELLRTRTDAIKGISLAGFACDAKGSTDTAPVPGRSGFATAAALDVQRRDILILIVGDGVMRQKIEESVGESGTSNVRLMPLLIEADYQGLLAASDLCLVLQAPGTGQYFFPSKLLSILSMEVPVLSVADQTSEVAKAVLEGQFGVNILPAQPAAVADALISLSASPERLQTFRRNTSWVERFSAENVLGQFEQKLVEVARRAQT